MDNGVTPTGSGCQPSASAANASSQSGIPNASALPAWWPIPVSKDNEGMFCDHPSEGAATGLLALMTGISEDNWCASWMSGLELALWRARENGPLGDGQGWITQRQCDLLRLLSDEADGWWHFVDDLGPRFAPLDAWRTYASAIEARSGETGTGSTEGESAVAQPDAQPNAAA